MAETFRDIVDLSSVQALLESLTEATGIPASLIAQDGDILISSGWQDVCALFHRTNPESERNCRRSDLYFSRYLEENGFPPDGYIQNHCKNGLIELGLPVIVNDKQMATLLFGRFLPESADFEFFQNQAAEFNFASDEYLAAIKRMPVFD